VESRAAGIEHLVDGVFMQIDDHEALRREAELARTLGYGGKLAIHPRQIPILHEVFTPDREELDRCRELVEAFEQATRDGRGAFRLRGMMVDEANAKVARRTLAVAERLERSGR
jgi:citrate lyase subunit beta/citryl-CoA lyase